MRFICTPSKRGSVGGIARGARQPRASAVLADGATHAPPAAREAGQ